MIQNYMVKELHNIMPIVNIPTVLEYGILSHEKCSKLPHLDISMSEIQERRKKKVEGGLRLHEYANLYFDARNPMMYKRKEESDNLCVLQISPKVMELEGVVLSDRNASADFVGFYSLDYINSLDFDKIYARHWNHDNPIEKQKHKLLKCAEVLVPTKVDFDYIFGAYVVSDKSKDLLNKQGFDLKITINPDIFFR